MQISRLFEIVYILINKKTVTARELSEHFEVSQRTIYRDIETLCQAGIPIYTSKGKGGGISLLEHFVLNKSVLSEQEQREILAALSGFQAATNTDTQQVLHKLDALFGSKGSDWIEVDFSNWNSTEEDKSKFNQIKEAILSRNVLSFRYFNSYGSESNRTLEPYKLIFRGQAWYLYGFCRDKKDMRFFKITRIRDLRVEQEVFLPASIPEKISEDPVTAVSKPKLPVFLKIDARMGFRVYDEFPPEQIQRDTDGSFLVHANFHTGGWLTGYLMSYEDCLEVLEPLELREELRQKYKNIFIKYDI